MTEIEFTEYNYDDDLIEAVRADGRTRVRVYRLNGTAVVLGSGSRPALEVDLEACRVDGVPILKRPGGGCAVVVDPGNVIVSVAAAGLPFGGQKRFFCSLSEWLIDGLDRIGFPGIGRAGICDLVKDGRKVAGACLYRSRDLLYYSASVLVDPDLDKVTRYLKHPPREPEYRAGRKHGEFMGKLSSRRATNNKEETTGPEETAEHLRRILRPPDLVENSAGGKNTKKEALNCTTRNTDM